MKKYIYQVTAIVKANCTEYKYVVDVDADNQKEAVQTAKGMWDKVHHLFHVKARRLEAHEEALYAFWTRYEGEPQTKSKPEEAHVDIDEMTRAPAPETEPAETETAPENVSETCEDAALRKYINAAIQAEQAATEAADIAEAVKKFTFLVRKHNEMMNNAHIASLERESAAEMDYLKSADRLYKAIRNAEARLRNAGADVKVTDGDYPYYHITGVTVNGCAVYPEAAPEETPDAQEPEAVTETAPAPEFDYDFLDCRYVLFEHVCGSFSNEYETDKLKEARDRLKEEWDGSLESGDWGLFDRDARQYIRIRATAKGRKAFMAENARLAMKAAPQEPDATPEPVSDAEGATDGVETETVELHDDIDTYAVCEKNGITWTRVNTDTLAIRADDYRRLLDGAVNKQYIRNLRRDSNTGRFCGGAFTLAGTITE